MLLGVIEIEIVGVLLGDTESDTVGVTDMEIVGVREFEMVGVLLRVMEIVGVTEEVGVLLGGGALPDVITRFPVPVFAIATNN